MHTISASVPLAGLQQAAGVLVGVLLSAVPKVLRGLTQPLDKLRRSQHAAARAKRLAHVAEQVVKGTARIATAGERE